MSEEFFTHFLNCIYMKKQIFPIPFEVIQKYKYLYFILGDIFMGGGAWLLSGLLLKPETLFTRTSFYELFVLLWFCYPALFFMYEYAKKKHEKKSCSNKKCTKD